MGPQQLDWTQFFLESLVGPPAAPSKHTSAYQEKCVERLLTRRLQLESRADASTLGRVIPDEDQLAIGEGKHFSEIAVLFLDICGFSNLANWSIDEQKMVLKTLNLFMGEMLSVVRDFGGTFEKNTGDGLMAYFGEGAKTAQEAVKPAVEAAVMMHYINSTWIDVIMRKLGQVPIKFRVGIDTGPITVARVAIPGGSHGGIVAIGTTANVACKLMRLIPEGGICIGEKTYRALPNRWEQSCTVVEQPTGFVYVATQQPYQAWTLDYRAPFIALEQKYVQT
jgi:class 3 adenylate cyclase